MRRRDIFITFNVITVIVIVVVVVVVDYFITMYAAFEHGTVKADVITVTMIMTKTIVIVVRKMFLFLNMIFAKHWFW